MKRSIFYLLPLFLIVFGINVSACGTESEPGEPEPEGKEFQLEWPEGGEIITDNRDGNTGQITLQYDNSRYNAVVGFYEDYTSGNGWNRSEIGQGEVPTINYMNLESGLNISVDPPDDQISGAFIVTLTVS